MSRGWAALVALGVTAITALGGAVAAADSFTPVTLSIGVTAVARLGTPLRVRVSVHADPGVLDTADGPLRVKVKLAPECGSSFETTAGVTLVNAALKPRPTVGRVYSGSASGSGRPVAYGTRTVCSYLEDGADRLFANDESVTTDVTPACTTAGRGYDRSLRSLRAARRTLRRAHTRTARNRDRRLVAKRRRAVIAARRRGVAACGAGVAL